MISNKKHFKKNEAGFTLIELLVVVSIISLLSSIVLVAMNKARLKARDSVRLSTLHQIQAALELYNADHNGLYPNTGTVGPTDPVACTGITSTYWCFDCTNGIDNTSLAAALSPYMKSVKDPRVTAANAGYYYNSDSIRYKLLSFNAPEDMRDFSSGLIDPKRCGGVDGNGQCTAGNPWGPFNTIGFWSDNYALCW